MNRRLRGIFVLIAVAFVGSLGTWVAAVSLAGKRTIERAYTLETKVTNFVDGDISRVTRNIYAARSDGMYVTSRSYQRDDGSSLEVRSISDPTNRVRQIINSGIESITSLPLSERTAEAIRNRHRYCGNDPKAAKDEVLGIEVLMEVLAPSKVIGKGTTVPPTVERWVAPRLGCATLKTKISHGGKVTSVEEATFVQLGEPDPKLFELSSHYQEMSPAETFSHLSERFDIPEPEIQLLKTLEDGYQKRRIDAKWPAGESGPRP